VLAATVLASAGANADCRRLLPQATIERVVGGKVTLKGYGPSEFTFGGFRVHGTRQTTTCPYGTAKLPAKDGEGSAVNLVTGFQETPQRWNEYLTEYETDVKEAGKKHERFVTLNLGRGNRGFAQVILANGEPNGFYAAVSVDTPLDNVFVFALKKVNQEGEVLDGVPLSVEKGIARELSKRIDKEWLAAQSG
jgi:hypothetical protein